METAEEARCQLRILALRFPALNDTVFNVMSNQKLQFTVWKIYVLDRSFVFTAFGTLLTYGILLATLGNSAN